jgi:bifunctional ADP-heptose synthase (sugar kinase/adenylyltransferase)
MKMRIIKELIKAKEELNKEVEVANQLLAKIESAEKRGGVLLLNDLDAGLIEKLQALTPDDNVIIIFTPDGSRIEIKHKDTNYSNKPGMVR